MFFDKLRPSDLATLPFEAAMLAGAAIFHRTSSGSEPSPLGRPVFSLVVVVSLCIVTFLQGFGPLRFDVVGPPLTCSVSAYSADMVTDSFE